LLLKEQEEPEEALEGQGEIQMTEASSDLVQKQLWELAEQIVHVIEACNKEKDVLKEDFDSVRNGILIMESRLQTEKTRIDLEVQEVGSMMNFQQAILEEVRSGIHILQDQDNQIVGEATHLLVGIRMELEAQSKRMTDVSLTNFAQKVSVQAIQKSVGILSKKIDDVTTVVAAITESLKSIPTKQELRQHKVAMEETMNSIAEVNTGLTTAMDQYKFSDSTPVRGRQSVAGPSGTRPFMDPGRAAAFGSPSVSSLGDMGSEYSWNRRIRGGAGSDGAADGGAADGAAGGAADRAAGGAVDGAAGGAAGGEGPPPPPDPPPSDHGGNAGGRISRRRR
jgi:predicted  nucleic acid-binding Zn-ribbon protein